VAHAPHSTGVHALSSHAGFTRLPHASQHVQSGVRHCVSGSGLPVAGSQQHSYGASAFGTHSPASHVSHVASHSTGVHVTSAHADVPTFTPHASQQHPSSTSHTCPVAYGTHTVHSSVHGLAGQVTAAPSHAASRLPHVSQQHASLCTCTHCPASHVAHAPHSTGVHTASSHAGLALLPHASQQHSTLCTCTHSPASHAVHPPHCTGVHTPALQPALLACPHASQQHSAVWSCTHCPASQCAHAPHSTGVHVDSAHAGLVLCPHASQQHSSVSAGTHAPSLHTSHCPHTQPSHPEISYDPRQDCHFSTGQPMVSSPRKVAKGSVNVAVSLLPANTPCCTLPPAHLPLSAAAMHRLVLWYPRKLSTTCQSLKREFEIVPSADGTGFMVKPTDMMVARPHTAPPQLPLLPVLSTVTCRVADTGVACSILMRREPCMSTLMPPWLAVCWKVHATSCPTVREEGPARHSLVKELTSHGKHTGSTMMATAIATSVARMSNRNMVAVKK